MGKALKLLFLDIETAPATAYVWRAKVDYVNHDMLRTDRHMIGWGAKMAGGRTVKMDYNTPDEMVAQDDKRITESLTEIIHEADISCAHNGDGFDFPVLNGRILKHQTEPLGPIRTIDTLKLAKKNFDLTFNKLDYLADYLGIGRKIKTDMDLWKRCVAGEQKALDEMKRYNRKDVVLLEAVFDKMKPYVRNLPRLFVADYFEERICPHCGKPTLIVRKYYETQGLSYPQYQCTTCKRYSKGRNQIKDRKIGVHPL